jgi:hypothetical protein
LNHKWVSGAKHAEVAVIAGDGPQDPGLVPTREPPFEVSYKITD